MDFPPYPLEPHLDSAKEEDTPNTKLSTAFKKIVHRKKWLVSHLTFSDKLYILQFNFTSGEERWGSDGYYIAEVGLSSAAWRIESNYLTHYIQGGGMVPGK